MWRGPREQSLKNKDFLENGAGALVRRKSIGELLMASVNQVIEQWNILECPGELIEFEGDDVMRVIAAFTKMRELLRYVADQKTGAHGPVIDALINESTKLLA